MDESSKAGPNLPASGMAEVRMDVAAVRARAMDVLGNAGRIAEINCPTMDSAEMIGSAVARATSPPILEERLADLVGQLRGWAAAVQDSATAIDSAVVRHTRMLDE